jgi:hypothetical protein
LTFEKNASLKSAEERRVRRAGGGGDLWRIFELAEGTIVELFRLGPVVPGLARIHRQHDEFLGLEPGVDPMGALETPEEESARDQRDDG